MPVLGKYSYYLGSIWTLLTRMEDPWLTIKIFTGRTATGTHQVALKNPPLRFIVRGGMDVWSVKETFIDGFYEKCGFTIQPSWTVLDIGAAIGEYTVYAAVRAYEGKVFAFEPFPQSADLLARNISLNHLQNTWFFVEAVSSQDGLFTLEMSGDPLQFQTRAHDQAETGRLQVKAAGLGQLFERLEVQRFDLVKLDCEGAEYDILLNLPAETFARIDRIVMEYHDHVTAYSHLDLVRVLSNSGYHVDVFPNVVHSYLGYLRAIRLDVLDGGR
jgi:FkbM family methyltransferase